MYALNYNEECDVMEVVNKYHYTINRHVEFHEQRIINENDEVEWCVQLWATDNNRTFNDSDSRFSSDHDIIIEDMDKLGLTLIKEYSQAWANDDIIRVLCFRKKNTIGDE